MEGRGRGEDPPLTFPCLLSSQLPRQTGAEMLVMQATLFLFLPLQKGARNSPEFRGKIPGFLGFSCSSYCGQIPGFSWNTTPGFPRKQRISLLFQPFLGFLEVKKHGKAKKARSSGLFLALRAFAGFFLQGFPSTIILLTTSDCLTIFLNCTQVCPWL